MSNLTLAGAQAGNYRLSTTSVDAAVGLAIEMAGAGRPALLAAKRSLPATLDIPDVAAALALAGTGYGR